MKIEQQQLQPAELITEGVNCGFDYINLQTSTLLLNCITELAFKWKKGKWQERIHNQSSQCKCVLIQFMLHPKSKLLRLSTTQDACQVEISACISKCRGFRFQTERGSADLSFLGFHIYLKSKKAILLSLPLHYLCRVCSDVLQSLTNMGDSWYSI